MLVVQRDGALGQVGAWHKAKGLSERACHATLAGDLSKDSLSCLQV